MNQGNYKTWEPVDFIIYLSFVKWIVAAAVILEIFFRWRVGAMGDSFLFDQIEIFIWCFRFFVFVFLAWRVVKNFGQTLAVAAMAGALAGFSIGLVISLYRFFEGVKIWKFFNIVTETTLVAALGALAGIAFVYILNLKTRWS